MAGVTCAAARLADESIAHGGATVVTPNSSWLATTHEAAVEPDLPIIDPHHHLWDFPRSRYFLDELLEDTADLNVRQTVFIECGSMYRGDGPEPLRPVGETEFVAGVAAQSASGNYGEMRACSGHRGPRQPEARRGRWRGARRAHGDEPALPRHPPSRQLGRRRRRAQLAARAGAAAAARRGPTARASPSWASAASASKAGSTTRRFPN